MREYIKKIQNKSEEERKKFFSRFLFSFMIFVVLVWVLDLSTRFDNPKKEQTREDVKPFALFKESLDDTYKNISASVGNASLENLNKKEEVKEEKEKQVDLIIVDKTN